MQDPEMQEEYAATATFRNIVACLRMGCCGCSYGNLDESRFQGRDNQRDKGEFSYKDGVPHVGQTRFYSHVGYAGSGVA